MNKHEIGALFKSIGIGILVALGIFLALFLLAFFTEIWNCGCGIFMCSDLSCPSIEKFASNYMVYLFAGIISVVVGVIVGLFSALSKRSNRRTNEINAKNSANQKSINKELVEVGLYAKAKANTINDYSPKLETSSEDLKTEFLKHKSITETKHKELSQIIDNCKIDNKGE